MRYFFHLHNDIQTQDEEGLELPDLAAARLHAEQAAREMAAESVRQGHLNLSHCIEVVSADETERLIVRFGDAIRIVGQSSSTRRIS